MSKEAQSFWASYKLDVERKGGELLRSLELLNGRPEKRYHDGTGTTTVPFRLSDLGVDKKQSSAWQRIADIPAEEFERFKTETRAEGKEITEAAALMWIIFTGG